MRRISRKQRCAPAILSWQEILESGKYLGNGEHQDRRPRRQQNPRSRRRHPRDQRKLVRCCDERGPDLAIVLLSNVPAFYLVDFSRVTGNPLIPIREGLPTTRPESSASSAMGCVGYNLRAHGPCGAGWSCNRRAFSRSNHGSR
jgi:hypothetical protein